MSSEPAQTTGSTETTAALGELARALRRVAEGSSLDDALRSIADATLVAAAADVVVVRVTDDEGGLLEARAVSASSTSVAAELQGSRTAAGAGPDALLLAGQRLGFGVALELPIAFGDRELGRLDDDLQPHLAGAFGSEEPDERGVVEALGATTAFSTASGSWVLQLGQPAFGVLQLRFEQPVIPSDEVLDALTTFAARAAHALRSSEWAQRQSVELQRSRALVAVVGQAMAQLSLSHTLETAIERISELLDAERLAVYLLEPEEDRLLEAAGRGLAGPHTPVAERLVELARGPLRGHDAMLIEDATADPRLAPVREQ